MCEIYQSYTWYMSHKCHSTTLCILAWVHGLALIGGNKRVRESRGWWMREGGKKGGKEGGNSRPGSDLAMGPGRRDRVRSGPWSSPAEWLQSAAQGTGQRGPQPWALEGATRWPHSSVKALKGALLAPALSHWPLGPSTTSTSLRESLQHCGTCQCASQQFCFRVAHVRLQSSLVRRDALGPPSQSNDGPDGSRRSGRPERRRRPGATCGSGAARRLHGAAHVATSTACATAASARPHPASFHWCRGRASGGRPAPARWLAKGPSSRRACASGP